MTPPNEIEQARARVSVACLRWLRAEVEAAHPPRAYVIRERERTSPPDDPPPVARGRDHPLWDRWIDG